MDISHIVTFSAITFSILSLLFVFLFTHVYICCEFNVVFWVSAYKCICQYQPSWTIFVLYLAVVCDMSTCYKDVSQKQGFTAHHRSTILHIFLYLLSSSRALPSNRFGYLSRTSLDNYALKQDQHW